MARKRTTEEFSSSSRKIHSGKYDYSLVKYIGNKTKVEIVCPTHGLFLQRPNNHLSGHGCTLCKTEKLANIRRSDKENFVNQSNLMHNSEFTPHFHKTENIFYDQVHRDLIKSTYAAENQYQLIKISYGSMNAIGTILRNSIPITIN